MEMVERSCICTHEEIIIIIILKKIWFPSQANEIAGFDGLNLFSLIILSEVTVQCAK